MSALSAQLASPLLSPVSRTPSPTTVDADSDSAPPSPRRKLALLLAGTFALYLVLGVFERLAFAQMVLLMPTGVLLMHTLLALMSLLLFVVLQLARSQSTMDEQPVSDALQQLQLSHVLQMAAIDAVRSLLALSGAVGIPGVAQTMLLQAHVPFVALLDALLPLPPPEKEEPERRRGWRRTLRQEVVHMVDHLSPGQCVRRVALSPLTYRVLGATLVAAAVVAIAMAAPAPPLAWGATHDAAMRREALMRSRIAHGGGVGGGDGGLNGSLGGRDAAEIGFVAAESTAGREMTPISGRDAAEIGLVAEAPASPAGRWLFAASTFFAALSAVHKRRCLADHPVDQLSLNTCLAALQLFVGLVLGPPLLLLVCGQPVRDTLLLLARGLRCCMSAFNSSVCSEALDAFGAPMLLSYFIATTAWSAASFGLLRVGEGATKRWVASPGCLLPPSLTFPTSSCLPSPSPTFPRLLPLSLPISHLP